MRDDFSPQQCPVKLRPESRQILHKRLLLSCIPYGHGINEAQASQRFVLLHLRSVNAYMSAQVCMCPNCLFLSVCLSVYVRLRVH